ncbi:MAG: DUF302 domain-containing protein [Bacteroidales bacterium]
MNKMVTGLIIGVIAGTTITLLIIFFSAPSMMFKENKSNYDFQTTITELEKSVEAVGWKIPHVNDMQETMHKFGKEVKQVKVYEICQPGHAYKILSQDDERIVSSLMPCRIAIYEKSDGSVYLSRLNAGLMSKPMRKIIRTTMKDASDETEQILKPVISMAD